MLIYCNLIKRVFKYMYIDSIYVLFVNIYVYILKNLRFISLFLNMVCCLYCVCSICILNFFYRFYMDDYFYI